MKVIILTALLAAVCANHLGQHQPLHQRQQPQHQPQLHQQQQPQYEQELPRYEQEQPQYKQQQPQYQQSAKNDAKIISQEMYQDGQGNFKWSYEQTDGQKVKQEGEVLEGYEPETGGIAMQGGYEWTAPNGVNYQLYYTADQGGFQPQADHLPVAPAQIPAYAQLRQKHPELFWAEGLEPQQQQEEYY